MSQGSTVRPLLFNIQLHDLFFFLKDVNVYSFFDDTVTYICKKYLANVLKLLEKNLRLALRWFEKNYVKFKTDT